MRLYKEQELEPGLNSIQANSKGRVFDQNLALKREIRILNLFSVGAVGNRGRFEQR